LDNFGGEVVTGGTVPAGNDGVVTGPVGIGVVSRTDVVGEGRAVGVPVLSDVQPATATINAAATPAAANRTDDIAPPIEGCQHAQRGLRILAAPSADGKASDAAATGDRNATDVASQRCR
jgi:hypothetical protein